LVNVNLGSDRCHPLQELRGLCATPISLFPGVTAAVTKIDFYTTALTNDSHALRPAEGTK
jgi:hypothetical protein